MRRRWLYPTTMIPPFEFRQTPIGFETESVSVCSSCPVLLNITILLLLKLETMKLSFPSIMNE